MPGLPGHNAKNVKDTPKPRPCPKVLRTGQDDNVFQMDAVEYDDRLQNLKNCTWPDAFNFLWKLMTHQFWSGFEKTFEQGRQGLC